MAQNGVARALRIALVTFPAMLAGTGVLAAKDLKQLAQLLSMPYLAERFAIACASVSPSFQEATRGELGDVRVYREHFEAEIFDGLSLREAATVSEAAHRAARVVFEDSVRKLGAISGYSDAQKAQTWCRVTGREFIAKLIKMHDFQHATIDKIISDAKQ